MCQSPSTRVTPPSRSRLQRLTCVPRRCWRGSRHRIGHALDQADNRAAWFRQRPLFCVLAGLMGGSLLGVSVPLSPPLMVLFLLAVALVWRRWPQVQLQGCCRFLLLGMLLTHLPLAWQQRALPLDHIAHWLPTTPHKRVSIEGHLYRPVEARGDRQRLYVRLHRLRDTQGWRPVLGRVRLNVHTTELSFLPGDVIQVHRLRLHPIRNFQNPGGFNYRRLMHRQGIYAVGGVSRPDRVHLLRRPSEWSPARTWVRWRRSLAALVQTHLPPSLAPVFAAMVLGQRGNLPPDLQEAFRAAGTAHLLVVSGLHVGFVLVACFIAIRTVLRLLRCGLPRAWLPAWRPTPLAALGCLPPVLLYCSVVGWKISTLRAALMVGSSMLALVLSRSHHLMYALGLAAALILLLEAQALFTLGFQLSFVAVTMILLVNQRFAAPYEDSGLVYRWRQRLRTALLAMIAAYTGTLPILASAFHLIPTYGALTNLVLVPLAGLIVPAGVAALVLSVAWPALASVAFAPLAPLLSWVTALVQYVAALPGAQYPVPAPSAPAIAGYYGLLCSILAIRTRWRFPCAGVCAAVLLASIGWHYLETRTPHLRVTFLDVGTGDAILVQIPGNHNLLIDGGGTYDGRFDIGANVVAPVLWQRHIRRFELMALTHTHPNHARGLVSLFRRFPTRHVLTNGSPLRADYLRDLMRLSQRRGIRVHTAQTGPRQWQWERLQLTVLAPPSATAPQRASWRPPTENDRSLVMRLQYGATRLLLTSDIQYATERWLVAHAPDLRADVLQIPHHGSRTSTLPEFVQRVQPRVGIMSLGSGNPYGHPHARVLTTLQQHQVKVFRTDLHGAVTFTSDGTHYRVTPFRPYRPPLPVRVTP